nr:ribonuclease H-like domain, reverse transcriptase, RNA-dependent DNA polymerase [Tanacetum cinerariifolium]
MKGEESLNVTFDESPLPTKLSPLVDDDVVEEEVIKNNIKVVNNNSIKDESIEVDEFGLEDSKPTKTPMSTEIKLTKDDESDYVDNTKYQDKAGNEIEVPSITVQQILARTRERKAQSTLLMAIPDEHLARFHGIKYAKTLWAAIQTRFGGSAESKKMQKNVLNSPQLDNKDLEQINQDDLEEMDLKWQVTMLSMRVRQFYKKTKRKLEFNAKEPVGFDKTKVGCFNCHRRGHFARDCRSARIQGTEVEMLRMQEEEATDFALMALTSNPLSSSNSNSKVQSCSKQCEQSYEQLKTLFDEQHEKLSKANIEIIGYQYGLESIEEQLRVHQQNEVIYVEKIGVVEYQIKDKSNLLKYTQKQLDEALREKEDLKAKLVKFESSLKNLTKLLDSQISAKVKIVLGYDSQFNKKEVLDVKEKEVTKTVFDNRASDEENSLANDRFKKSEGYYAVLPPLTWNYMPPKSDLSFSGLDDSIYTFKISETVTSVTKDEKDVPKTSIACVDKPKEDRFSAPLIQDWDSDSDNNSMFSPELISAKIDFVKAGESVKHVKPVESVKHMAKKFVLPTNVGKGTGHSESRPVWNNVQRINHHNKFAPTAVFTRSGKILVSAAKPKAAALTSAAKPVNTAGPKQSVNFLKSRSTFHKSHSPIRRSFYNATTHSRRNSTERVNTVGSKAVSVVKGNGVTAVKTSAGHPHQALKNKGIVDSGCFRHMTGNKAYLADYQEINYGGPQDTNGNAGTQDNVDAGQEVSDQHYISSDDKAKDDKTKHDIGSKTIKELVNKEDQAYKDEHDRLTSQEKEASDAVDALRKESEQGCIDQRGTTKAGSTNLVNTVSNPVNAASTSGTFSTGGPSSPHPDAFIPAHTLLLVDQDDSQIPNLEDTAKLQSSGIFNSAYDDDLDIFTSPIQSVGAEANFNNIESSIIVRIRKIKWGIVVRSKARLVAQGHRQEKGIDCNEVFAHVARIEAIRIFLAFASFMGFIVYQMDVKSAFLYGKIEEEVYVCQPPSIIDPQFPNKVYKVEKALYGQHQAPRAWAAASTPIETHKPLMKDEGAADVDIHLYRSMIGSLMYLKASRPDIMFAVCACSRFQVTLKLLHLHAVKRIFRYLKGQPKLGLWYLRDSPFDLEAYSDSDYAGANLNRKSTIGGCQFLGRRLISWQCKKQTIVATSTIEVEYVAAVNYYGFKIRC